MADNPMGQRYLEDKAREARDAADAIEKSSKKETQDKGEV